MDVFYGWKNLAFKICNYEISNNTNLKECSTPSALSSLISLCENKPSCVIDVSPDYFQDNSTCSVPYKFLRVKYKCVKIKEFNESCLPRINCLPNVGLDCTKGICKYILIYIYLKLLNFKNESASN